MSQHLRARFLAALAATGVVSIAACGGAIADDLATPAAPDGGVDSAKDSADPCATQESAPSPSKCYGDPERELCIPGERMREMIREKERSGAPSCADVHGCLPRQDLWLDCASAIAGPFMRDAECCYRLCEASPGCGRPFLVNGVSCTAAIVERTDWADGALADAPASSEDRERLAGAWARDAAMEHASIAAFARFTLELLAHGAPADMVAASQDAGADETRHASACFGIASRLAGRALGPGRLVVGVIEERSLADVVASTVIEGCIGETLSALVAEARLQHAVDAKARAALSMIAEDEARHAELAWRFVGWAIQTGGPAVREAAAKALREIARAMPSFVDPSLTSLSPRVVREHGLLDEASAREVVAAACRDVIAPCAAFLLEGVAHAA
jgi:hypothetical protein